MLMVWLLFTVACSFVCWVLCSKEIFCWLFIFSSCLKCMQWLFLIALQLNYWVLPCYVLHHCITLVKQCKYCITHRVCLEYCVIKIIILVERVEPVHTIGISFQDYPEFIPNIVCRVSQMRSGRTAANGLSPYIWSITGWWPGEKCFHWVPLQGFVARNGCCMLMFSVLCSKCFSIWKRNLLITGSHCYVAAYCWLLSDFPNISRSWNGSWLPLKLVA